MRSLSPVVIGLGIGLGGITAPGLVQGQPANARAPSAALAARAEEPSVAASGGDAALRTVEARRRYQEGNAAMKLHQWQKAYDAYHAAWRQKQHWQIAGSLGQVELKLAKHRDAALHLAVFLREAKDVPPEEMKRVREWLEQAKAKVAVLTIEAAPPGSEILLDGLKIGQAPLREEVYVEPGKHLVEGRLGPCVATSEVELTAGHSKEIALRCAATPPAQSTGVLAPPRGAPVDESAGAKRYPPEREALLIAGTSVTVASLALGFTSIAIFTSKGSQARQNHEPASGPNATTEANFKSVALWGFVAAGIAGGGTILYQIKSEQPRRAPVKGSLFIGPTGGAAVVQGEF